MGVKRKIPRDFFDECFQNTEGDLHVSTINGSSVSARLESSVDRPDNLSRTLALLYVHRR